MNVRAALLAAAAGAAVLIVDVPPARAAGAVEEVIVTARKREESAQDVPIAIQAFNADAIQRYAATDLTQISEMATQVIVNPGASGNGGGFNIRGVGAPTLDPGLESSVIVNIDGVEIDRGNVVRQAFFDLDNVQVLKGPQALFFGKNSTAGVIALTSAKPSLEEREFRIQTGYEFENQGRNAEVMLSGPLTDTLAARLAYRYTATQGFLDNKARPIDAATAATLFPTEPFAFPGGTQEHIGDVNSQALARNAALAADG